MRGCLLLEQTGGPRTEQLSALEGKVRLLRLEQKELTLSNEVLLERVKRLHSSSKSINEITDLVEEQEAGKLKALETDLAHLEVDSRFWQKLISDRKKLIEFETSQNSILKEKLAKHKQRNDKAKEKYVEIRSDLKKLQIFKDEFQTMLQQQSSKIQHQRTIEHGTTGTHGQTNLKHDAPSRPAYSFERGALPNTYYHRNAGHNPNIQIISANETNSRPGFEESTDPKNHQKDLFSKTLPLPKDHHLIMNKKPRTLNTRIEAVQSSSRQSEEQAQTLDRLRRKYTPLGIS